MPEVSKPCSVFNGYNFKQDQQDRIGHVTKLKIGTVDLAADQTIKSPLDGADVKVVILLSDWFWQGGDAEPIQVSGQVSATNKQKIGQMLHGDMSNTEVLIEFNVYEYDPVDKKFFKCIHTNDAQLKGLVMKNGTDLVIDISDTSSPEVPEPENFTFSLGVMPQRQEQDLHLAFSVSGKTVKKWGITVSA